MELQCAGEQPELIRQIFEQQAARGYYDDAAATGLRLRRAEEVEWSVVELARIRAANGDLSGAKAMMKRFAGPSLSPRIADSSRSGVQGRPAGRARICRDRRGPRQDPFGLC